MKWEIWTGASQDELKKYLEENHPETEITPIINDSEIVGCSAIVEDDTPLPFLQAGFSVTPVN